MDPVDRATDTIEVCMADALRRSLGKSAPESDPEFDGVNCVDCEDKIPQARLDLGKVRCVDCQERLELKRKMGVQ